MWSVTLNSDKKEWEWLPEDPTDQAQDEDDDDEDEDPSYKPNHRLLVKNAILDPEAEENEPVVLELETTGFKKEKVVTPIVAMRGGTDLQRYIDLLIPTKGKIKLIKGKGPITLVGSHCVEYNMSPYDDESEEDEEEEGAESSEDDEVDMEQEQETTAQKKEDKSGDKKKKATKEEEVKEKEAEPEAKKTPKKTPTKEGKKTPTKEGKKTPKKDEEPVVEEKKTPGKEGKKRKASGDADDGKKKRKSSGGN